MTQTSNFLQADIGNRDELFCLSVLDQKGEYKPQWQATIEKAGEDACIGYVIGWSVYHDQTPIDQAQRDLDSLGLGYVVDWVVAYSYLEPEETEEQPVSDPDGYDPECTDASNHFSPEDK